MKERKTIHWNGENFEACYQGARFIGCMIDGNYTDPEKIPEGLQIACEKHSPSDLEMVQSIFDFLTGNLPEGMRYPKRHQPKLTPDQAWTVIWALGNAFYKIPDFIERCDLCGSLYDSQREGNCLDYGKAPYHFCDSCMETDVWYKKARRNPDKSMRP